MLVEKHFAALTLASRWRLLISWVPPLRTHLRAFRCRLGVMSQVLIVGQYGSPSCSRFTHPSCDGSQYDPGSGCLDWSRCCCNAVGKRLQARLPLALATSV